MKKKMSKLFSNIKKYLKKIKDEHLIKDYILSNPVFITYVLINVINSTLLRFFTIHTVENYLSIKPIIV